MNATTTNAVRNYAKVLRCSQIHPSSPYFRIFLQITSARWQIKNISQYYHHKPQRGRHRENCFKFWSVPFAAFYTIMRQFSRLWAVTLRKNMIYPSVTLKEELVSWCSEMGKKLKRAGVTEAQSELHQYDCMWYVWYLSAEFFSSGCTWANPQKGRAGGFSSHSLVDQLFSSSS